MKKVEERNFSSEGFLRQAKGPFAKFYRSMLPDFHGYDAAMDELLSNNQPEPTDVSKLLAAKDNPLSRFSDQVKRDWGAYAARAESHYGYKKRPTLVSATAGAKPETKPDAKTPAAQPAGVAKEKPAEKPAEKLPEKAAEKPADKPVEKPAEAPKPAESPVPPTIKATEPETPAAFGLVPVAALVAVQEKSPEPNAAKPAEAASAKPDAKSEGKPAKALEASATEVDEKQLAALVLERQFAALDDAVSDFRKWLMENPHEVTHWQKLGKSRSLNEIPYEKPRYTEQMGKVFAQKAKFLADVKKLETELEGDLFNIKPLADQQKLTVLDQPATWLSKFDRFVTYSLLAIGVCLMVGLFSRVAALGGAFFLLSVIGTQPPFVLDALPVYEQTIELLALLVIAATATGKWAGLDYFLGRVCGCCCGSKGNCDAT